MLQCVEWWINSVVQTHIHRASVFSSAPVHGSHGCSHLCCPGPRRRRAPSIIDGCVLVRMRFAYFYTADIFHNAAFKISCKFYGGMWCNIYGSICTTRDIVLGTNHNSFASIITEIYRPVFETFKVTYSLYILQF